MSAPSVAVPYAQFLKQCDRHSDIVDGLQSVGDPRLRRLLAELVMMRLFDDFQEVLKGVAVRLACGAAYIDGSSPTLMVQPARSTREALVNFQTLGRGGKQKYDQWSKFSYVNETVKFVFHANDPFLSTCRVNSQVLSEMQVVRNRIAHSAVKTYPDVVRRYYGASFNHVTPGILLLSSRNSPPLLERYITSCRVLAKGVSGV
jgi:hypothetical protein